MKIEQINLTAAEFQEKLKSGEIFADQKKRLHWKEIPVSTSKPKIKKAKKMDKIDLFVKLCKEHLNIEVIPEYQFDKKRRWRADYAVIQYNILLEVEGGIYTQGRHTRGTGYKNDMEKYTAASLQGWTLIRVQPSELLTKGFQAIEKSINSNNKV
jgi:very-short-patch-repair endonuclease